MDQNASRHPGVWTTRQVVLATLLVAGVVAFAWLVYVHRGVVALLLLAIVLSTAIRPVVRWLQRRGISPALGVILVYAGVLLALTALIVLVAPPLVAQAGAFFAQLPLYYANMREALATSPSPLLQGLGGMLPAEVMLPVPEAPADGAVGPVIVQSLAYANAVVGGILSLAAVFLLGYYWTLDNRRVTARLLRWAPPARRDTIEGVITEIEDKLGHWVLAELLLAGIVGTMALIVYLLLGLPFAIVLAVIAAMMEVVPIIGPWVAGGTAVLVALSVDPVLAVWTAGAALAIQFLENNLLVPRLMRRVVGTHPLVTLLALAAFATVFGFAGVLLAVPMSAATQIALNRLVLADTLTEAPRPEGRDRASVLRYQIQELMVDVRKQLLSRDAPPGDAMDQVEDEIEAIAVDLDRLLERLNGEGEVSP